MPLLLLLLLLGGLDLFLSGGGRFLVVYGQTGDGRVNLGERDSHDCKRVVELFKKILGGSVD